MPISTTFAQQATPESALSDRLRSLRNASSSPSPASRGAPIERTNQLPTIHSTIADDYDPLRNPIDADDRSLDDLLAELGEDDYSLNPDDPKDIHKLLDEAKGALPQTDAKPANPVAEGERPGDQPQRMSSKASSRKKLTSDFDILTSALSNSTSKARVPTSEDESREAEDIIARLLDEVNSEKANKPRIADPPHSDYEDLRRDTNEEEGVGLSLPSAPSTLLDPPMKGAEQGRESLDFESDIAARMAALNGLGSVNHLGLPSAPQFKPSDKPIKGVEKKTFADEEIDSWCVICQDDATVKCLGCDGDVYCASCWKEGHMGPDAGYEEKKHKWAKFRRPN